MPVHRVVVVDAGGVRQVGEFHIGTCADGRHSAFDHDHRRSASTWTTVSTTLPTCSSSSASTSTPAPSAPGSPVLGSSSTSAETQNQSKEQTKFPETLYLDHARLATLRTDAADFTALYMLLMLFRQLVHSSASNTSTNNSGSRGVGVKGEDVMAVKKEVWEVGPAHLGSCFLDSGSASSLSGSVGAGAAMSLKEKGTLKVDLDVNRPLTSLTCMDGLTSFFSFC